MDIALVEKIVSIVANGVDTNDLGFKVRLKKVLLTREEKPCQPTSTKPK